MPGRYLLYAVGLSHLYKALTVLGLCFAKLFSKSRILRVLNRDGPSGYGLRRSRSGQAETNASFRILVALVVRFRQS